MSKKHGNKEAVTVLLNPRYYDRFYAHRMLLERSESEHFRRLWEKEYDSLPPYDKRLIDDYLKSHPGPRAERENQMKCE